jgi:hypothetical protein
MSNTITIASAVSAKIMPQSWEKQTFWKLNNGMTVIEEYNQCYGPFIKGIEDKDGAWHACDGRHTMEERFKFILEWDDGTLIRPNFQKKH